MSVPAIDLVNALERGQWALIDAASLRIDLDRERRRRELYEGLARRTQAELSDAKRVIRDQRRHIRNLEKGVVTEEVAKIRAVRRGRRGKAAR